MGQMDVSWRLSDWQVSVDSRLEGGHSWPWSSRPSWDNGISVIAKQFLVIPFVDDGNMKNHLKNLSAPSAKVQPQVPLTLMFNAQSTVLPCARLGLLKAGWVLDLMQGLSLYWKTVLSLTLLRSLIFHLCKSKHEAEEKFGLVLCFCS